MKIYYFPERTKVVTRTSAPENNQDLEQMREERGNSAGSLIAGQLQRCGAIQALAAAQVRYEENKSRRSMVRL